MTLKSLDKDATHRAIYAPVVLCLVLNAAVFVCIALENPKYLNDYREDRNPDAIHYVTLGRNIWIHAQFSRCAHKPLVPDFLRTPVWPVIAGGLHILGNIGLVYVFQAIVHCGSVAMLFLFVKDQLGTRAALLASFLFAADPVIVVSNFTAMSEPLFTLLILASAWCMLRVLRRRVVRYKDVIIPATFLTLATLTRPAGLYLVVVYGFFLLRHVMSLRKPLAAIGVTASFVVVFFVPVWAWIVRNYIVFSEAKFSMADSIMMVYFAGAGAFAFERDISLPEAQQQISEEYRLEPPEITNNAWKVNKPVAQIDDELRAAQRRVLMRYPASLIASSSIGCVKAHISHDTGGFALVLGRPSRSVREFVHDGSTLLLGIFLWQNVITVATWSLAIVGVARGFRCESTRLFAIFLCVVLLYFLLTVGLVGLDATFRSRLPHLPILCALAALAIVPAAVEKHVAKA